MGLWVTLPLREGEQVIVAKTGAVLIPGTELSLIGGLLVLTDMRLYHDPLDTRLAGRLLRTGADLAAPPGLSHAVGGRWRTGLPVRALSIWPTSCRSPAPAVVDAGDHPGREGPWPCRTSSTAPRQQGAWSPSDEPTTTTSSTTSRAATRPSGRCNCRPRQPG